MSFTAAEIAHHLNGEVIGDSTVTLNNFAPADRAQAGDLTFAENEDYLAKAEAGAASAVIVGPGPVSRSKILIRVKKPRLAFAQALGLFFPATSPPVGIHPTAVVAKTAQIDPSAHVGPQCVIGENVVIGADAVLLGGNHVAEDCELGAGTTLFPNVVLYANTQIGARVRIHAGTVIGADGFGYVQDSGIHVKVPQIGNVIIGDDVEIGANVTIDRGALGPTVIGKGTKIDNLVQIAHNVQIGEYCLLISQVGVAGSSRLGNYVVLAGQAGIAGHLRIGHRVTVAGQSGVMHNINDDEKWMGSPAQPDKEAKRQILAGKQLPDLLKRVAALEQRLEDLSTSLPPVESPTLDKPPA